MMDLNRWLDQELSLERLELLELAVPQVETFRTAIGVRHERRALFVRWFESGGSGEGSAPAGSWGIGECSCRPDPYFNEEFLAGARSVIEHFVFPALPRQGTMREVVEALGRIRGWRFTTAAVLEAATDALRRRGVADPLDLWPHPRAERIPVGISLGLFPSPEAAVERIGRETAEGYERIKLKIGPEIDRKILDSVRADFPDLRLGFDANGSFGAGDLDFLAGLAELEPVALEQPFAPGRLDLCLELKARAPRHAPMPGRKPHRRRPRRRRPSPGSPRRDQPQARSGRWHDTQPRDPRVCPSPRSAGLGRGHVRDPASAGRPTCAWRPCLPEALAHDLSPSRRYFAVDVLRQPIEMGSDGRIAVPEAPVELDEDVVEELTVDRRVLVKEKNS